MNRCTNCILPANYPGIKFDNKGVCQYCNEHKEIEYVGLESFVKKLEAFNKTKKDRNKDYDCLLGFSGGRDSTYLLYILTKELGLNVLCYSADHGYVPEQTILNMKRATDKVNNIEVPKYENLFTIKSSQKPISSINTPSNNAFLNVLNSISGKATDYSNSGIKLVELTIKCLNNNKYWTGSSWSLSQRWLSASTAGLFIILPTARIAEPGGFIIAVNSSMSKAPRLVMVKVAPE